MNKIFIPILILIFAVFGCTDEFRELNVNSSEDTSPEADYVLSTAMRRLETHAYHRYYGGLCPTILPMLGYVTEGDNGNTEELALALTGHRCLNYKGVLKATKLVQHQISLMDEAKAETKRALKGVSFVLQIFGYLQNMEANGEMQYTEAGLAPYTNPPILHPKYDSNEDMFNLWLDELDQAMADISAEGQVFSATQDIMYKGDLNKWAKLANSMKLRIACYLLNANRSKAISIAESVAQSSHGYLDDISEDWLRYLKDGSGGEGNSCPWKPATDIFLNMLKKYKDPRLFWFFTKNDFNPEIIQGFIDNGKALPPYVQEVCNFDSDGNFSSFKGDGEPWVRYHGMPTYADAQWKTLEENDAYFRQETACDLTIDGDRRRYKGVSYMQSRMCQPAIAYIYPSLPKKSSAVIEGGKGQYREIYMTSAEVNLMFAEFSLYGANLPKSANEYIKRGAELSIRRANAKAANFKPAYYDGDPYYKDNTSLALKEEWLIDYLDTELFDLSTDGLEKVYIQLFIEFFHRLEGQIPLFRRSGLPIKGSKYFAWKPMNAEDDLVWIRRFRYNTPSKEVKNYEILMESYTRQGFTLDSNEPDILSSERYWWDKNNPEAHAGPKN